MRSFFAHAQYKSHLNIPQPANLPRWGKVAEMNTIQMQEWASPANRSESNPRVPNSGPANHGSPALSPFEGDSIPATHVGGIAPAEVDFAQQELQFKARHIQMMALGWPPHFFLPDFRLRNGEWFIHSNRKCVVHQRSGIDIIGIFAHGLCRFCNVGMTFYRILLILQISLGEMVTLLPVPGGFITLASRCLSPGVVSFLSIISNG
jgi:hypothetical protein